MIEIPLLEVPSTTEPEPSKDGIRVLTPVEIESIKWVFDENSTPLPDPNTSNFIGYVEDGKVVGFGVLQLRLHAEPWWIKPGHQAKFSSMVHEMERFILERSGVQWVYVFAPAGKVAQMAASMGMQMEPWVVFSKLVTPVPLPPPLGAVELVTGAEAPPTEAPVTGEAVIEPEAAPIPDYLLED